MRHPLRFGPLLPAGYRITRSGLRWLCAEGEHCAAGSVIAYCNIGVSDAQGPLAAFAAEQRDLQVALVLRQAGRVHIQSLASAGSHLDQLEWAFNWHPEAIFAELETTAPLAPEGPLRPLFVSGRRATELAEVRDGLLSGWHDRKRAWWGDGMAAGGLLLGLGSCELTAMLRGTRPGMLDLLAGRPAGTQVAVVADTILLPCARTTREQLQRGPAEASAIAEDLVTGLLATGGSLTPAEWHTAGALQSALLAAPVADVCPVLLQGGPQVVARPDVVVMSLLAEPQRLLRHKRLGYHIGLYEFRLAEAGPGLRRWLRDAFEPVWRGPAEICADIAELAAALRAQGTGHVLVTNIYSSAVAEDVPGYAGFDLPLGRSIANVWNKELNLALAELAAREPGVAVVDVDMMAAELGAAIAMPDGVHVAGPMQAAVQQEILRLLAARRVPGFS